MKNILLQEKNYSFSSLRKIIKPLLVVLLLMFIFEVWLMNRLSTYGEKIEEIKSMRDKLELENQILENTLSEKLSLVKLESWARDLGFESIKNVEYIEKTKDTSP